MALSRLEQLKLKFKKDEEDKKSKGKSKETYYPFWQMDFDKQAIVRFLLDENQDNPNLYYVEKKEHTLSINGEDKKFPCLSMYGEECPICALASKYYSAAKKFPKDSDLQKQNQKKGKYYYRDRRYLMQALIKSDPLPPSDDQDAQALNNVKILQIGNELFQIIDSQIKRIIIEDSEDPFDNSNGYDFFIKKTKKRADDKDMASYAASTFARKPSEVDLTGKTVYDIGKFLPEKPSLEVLEQALNAHLNGLEDFDEDAVEHSESSEKPTETVKETMQQKLAALRRTEQQPEVSSQDEELQIVETKSTPKNTAPVTAAVSESVDDSDAEIEALLRKIKEEKEKKKK